MADPTDAVLSSLLEESSELLGPLLTEMPDSGLASPSPTFAPCLPPPPPVPLHSAPDATLSLDTGPPSLFMEPPFPEPEDARLAWPDSSDSTFIPPQPVQGLSPGFSSAPVSQPASVVASIDEDSQASRSSILSIGSGTKKRRINSDEDMIKAMTSQSQPASQGSSSSQPQAQSQSNPATATSYSFPAERIFEYQWPPMSSNYYLLQEQISEYLGIKSFKRKYPDLVRRVVEIEERRFLKDQGVVSETQCDLGLTALKSDHVMELMSSDYPEKYCEYLTALENKHQVNYSNNVTKGYQTPTVEKSKMGDFIRKTMKSVTEYNQHINQERKEERKVCMDLQTYTIHYPIGLGQDNKMLRNNLMRGRVRRPTKYPVATLPSQYQDWYIKYTPQELKYFPINTVLYGPVVTDPSKLPPLLTSAEEGSLSDSDSDSVASDEDAASCCSSKDGENKQEVAEESNKKRSKRRANSQSSSSSSSSDESEVDGPPPLPTLMKDMKGRPNATCKQCKGSCHQNKQGTPEELVHCSDCDSSAHPSCLELTTEMVDVIRSYPWQCMECKTCVHCGKPHDEDKMMFCDKCDRGYHTFCVGLEIIPTGKWVCRLCAQCAQCGVTTPGPNGKGKWNHETIKIISPNGDTLRRHQLLCTSCYKQRKQR